MPLTQEDQDFYRQMREFGVLQSVQSHQLHQGDGAMLVTCGDGDRFDDIWERQRRYMSFHRETSRIHVIALNGGALLIPEQSPLNQELREDLVIRAHMRLARTKKQIHTAVLLAHRPCGAAQEFNLSLEQTIELEMAAKARVVSWFADDPLFPDIPFKVACFLHLQHPEGERTWFVSRGAWDLWTKSRHDGASGGMYRSLSAL